MCCNVPAVGKMGISLLFSAIAIFVIHVTRAAASSSGGGQELCLNTEGASGPRPLSFCATPSGRGCCTLGRDAQIAAQFTTLGLNGVAAQPCADIVKKILCAECDPRAFVLHTYNNASSPPRPILCQGGACEATYEKCRRQTLSFLPLKREEGGVTLGERYPTVQDFAHAFCADSSKSKCPPSPHNKEPNLREGVLHQFTGSHPPSKTVRSRRELLGSASNLCFEKMEGSGSILNLNGHPYGHGYAVTATQGGLMNLVSIPPSGNGAPLKVVHTYLDLSKLVLNSGERGLLSFAFHPHFLSNGRFFVSYIVDGNAHPTYQGPCSCVASNGCTQGGSLHATCNSNTVISEYRVRNPTDVRSVPRPREARRYFNYGRPYSNHNGGYIMFGKDGYLYVTSGDGGYGGDPWNFAQNGYTYHGKIFRIDVDNIPAGAPYGIPPDNYFQKHSVGVLPEVYALGFRNPWRIAQDARRGTILVADVGQDRVEEIDLLVNGANYGWHNYEGTTPFAPGAYPNPGGYTPPSQMKGEKVAFPIFEYAHPGVNVSGIPEGGNCVIGGVVYRAARNKCLQGKYLYNDLSGTMWVSTIYPGKGKRRFTTPVAYSCATGSPLTCGGRDPFGSTLWSWGEDLSRDAYLLTTSGVFRLTDLSRCNINCT